VLARLYGSVGGKRTELTRRASFLFLQMYESESFLL
jgi:hypothetical protein